MCFKSHVNAISLDFLLVYIPNIVFLPLFSHLVMTGHSYSILHVILHTYEPSLAIFEVIRTEDRARS